MARPRLTETEKQFRKQALQNEKAAKRAAKKLFQDQIKLRDKRAAAFRKVMPDGVFTFVYFHLNTCGLVIDSKYDVVGYDQLNQLALVFGSTNINLGVETETNYDTFGGFEDPKMTVTIDDVDWRNLDGV